MILFHALKNELNNIIINTECLDGNDPAITLIQKSSKRILTLIQRINTELQDIQIRKTPNNLIELIEEILVSLDMYFKDNYIKVIKNLPNELIVKYDPFYFKEALLNIIKNAIEAMSNGGILEFSANIIEKHVVLTIKDTGDGISVENLPHVIDSFFSTKGNMEKNYGLGLTSSYRIIRHHKGVLEINSKQNTGTTILIRIPK